MTLVTGGKKTKKTICNLLLKVRVQKVLHCSMAESQDHAYSGAERGREV